MEQPSSPSFAVGYGNGYGYPAPSAAPATRAPDPTVADAGFAAGNGPSSFATDPTVRVDVTDLHLAPLLPGAGLGGGVGGADRPRRGRLLLGVGIFAALVLLLAAAAVVWTGQGRGSALSLANASSQGHRAPSGHAGGTLGDTIVEDPDHPGAAIDLGDPTGGTTPGTAPVDPATGPTGPTSTTTAGPTGHGTATPPASGPTGSGAGSTEPKSSGAATTTTTSPPTEPTTTSTTTPDAPPATVTPPTTPANPPPTLGTPPVSIKVIPSNPITLLPQITSFIAPSTAFCIPPYFGPTPIQLSWTTKWASSVTISIDGPGAYKTYAGASGSDSVPFSCPGSHTYTLTAHGSNGTTATKTVTVQM